MKKVLLPALLLTFSLGLTACGGGGATTEVSTSTQTLGQELIDLKNAYESGAMSESEYNKARERLIKSRQ